MAASSVPDICPPGVEKEMRAFPRQAVCLPRRSMLIPMEEGPPGVPVDTSSRNASSYMPNSTAIFDFRTPLSSYCGNTILPLPPTPCGGMALSFSTRPYSSFSQCPLPPSMPPPLPPPPPPPQRPLIPPSKVPRLGSWEETLNTDMSRKLFVRDKQKLTIFVGKILPSLDDDVVTSILKLCGSMKCWQRAKDPVTGILKGFGFCEYESPEGLLRALRLLNRLKLEGQELVLKVDKKTLAYLECYVDEKIQTLKPHTDVEAESVPGLEAAHAVRQQTLDVPREVPVEERLGWVFDEENEIDKEVCENLVKLLEERNRMNALDSPSRIADSGLDSHDDTAQASTVEEDLQRIKLIEWRKFEYDLEICKLRGQGWHGGFRGSDSFYEEYEKLWEERERGKEAHRNYARERDQEKSEMRKKLIKEQEEGRRDLNRMCSDERHKRRMIEREKDENDRILEQQESVDSTHLPKGKAMMQSKFLDLSTRAKVAFCFKSSSKLGQSEQTHMPAAGRKSLWEEGEDTGEGHNEGKQVVSPFDYMWTVGGDNWLQQGKVSGEGHRWHKQAVIRANYRNPTFTWERESTPEEQLPTSQKDVEDGPFHICSENKLIVPERCKPVTAKELIDRIPRTKDEIFAYCIDWETFDKHCLHERIRPWVSKKISEFLGEEEATLVDFIITSAKKHINPTHLLELLENIFVEEAELFVVKLWRMAIYEISKVKCGLTGSGHG